MGTVKDVLESLDSRRAGNHAMVVYQDLNLYREIYCSYAKSRLESGEVVILLPYFETIDSVLHYLKEYGIDVDSHRKGTTLIILDSVAQFFGTDPDFVGYLSLIDKRAREQGGGPIHVVADITAFHHFEDMEGMLEYERRMQQALKGMHVSMICCYHEGNFERLPGNLQQNVAQCHTAKLEARGV
jgi:hypothetical protein